MKYSAEEARKKAEMSVLENLAYEFRDHMTNQLREKQSEGSSGWDSGDERYDYIGHIIKAADEGRWIDVANLAMLKWNKEN